MDVDNVSTDISPDQPHSSMNGTESHTYAFETKLDHPVPPVDATAEELFEISAATDHDAQTVDIAVDEAGTPQDLDIKEQVLEDTKFPALDDRTQSLYDAYHTSYAFPINETSAHMQHAKDLASALLHRHYPTSDGYLVEPAVLGPYSANGVNFMLKTSNESDSDPDTPSPKKPKRTARKTNTQYSYEAAWHHIAPEYMAAFVVKKSAAEVREGVEVLTSRTHTCLIIILDDLATFTRWSRANLNHRGDVLSDMLGVCGGLSEGYGMLFFGPRLELYHYDASDDVQPVKPFPHQHWRTDMRTNSLAVVDEVLRGFVGEDVVYQDAY